MTRRSMVSLSLFSAIALGACADADEPAAPGPRCGNQIVEGSEECDDGNRLSGDGCSSCQMDNVQESVCGDGMVAQDEGCDDGATADSDGCSATCSVEPGYTCAGAPSVCSMQPGGANGTCQMPYVITLAPDMMGNLTGSGTGDTTSGSNQEDAAPCDGGDPAPGGGNDHVWKFTLTDTRDVFVLMPSTVTFDALIRLQSAACDAMTEIPEYTGADGCSDQSFEMDTEALAYTKLPAGTYYVLVDGFDAAAKGTYELQIYASTTTCGDGQLDLLDFCDDGNSNNNDGCSDHCEVEDGYTCDDASPSVCMMDNGGNAVAPAAGDLVINEAMLADNLADTNCDTSTKSNADEFVELVNKSNKTLDLTGVTIDDSASLAGTLGPRHVFAAAASGSLTLAPGKAVVVWGAGSPACAGVDNWFLASSGSLGLNDTGDTITVRTGGATPVVIVEKTFGASTLQISKTLNPDITGTAYIDHPMLGAKRWSPGRKQNDAAF